MLLHSSNGWPASADPTQVGARPFTVFGVDFPGGVRAGDVAHVLRYVVRQMHLRVEKMHPGWCWGGSFRPNRNSPRELSNHASYTAVDYNAPAHPNGVRGTWSAAQRAEIKKILAEVNNVVACGEFFNSTTDGMHLEICADPAAVHQVAVKLRAKKRTPVLVLVKSLRTPRAKKRATDHKIRLAHIRLGRQNADVLELQRALNRWYPQLVLIEDGEYGARTHLALARARAAFRLHGAVTDPKILRRLLKQLGFTVV